MFSDQLKRILKKFRSDKITKKIEEGKQVFFENTNESIAIRFVPGLQGRPGRYFAKHFGRDEYEVESNASAVVMGVMEGKPISVSGTGGTILSGVPTGRNFITTIIPHAIMNLP